VGQAAVMERRSLDRSARRMIVERTVSRPGGDEVNVHALRLYGAREIESMLRASGFDRIELYGDWDGGPVSAESLRVLAVGVREKEKGRELSSRPSAKPAVSRRRAPPSAGTAPGSSERS